jgi:hypothetical protein
LGILVRPRATIDHLAAEESVRWAVAVAALGVLQVWGNMAIFAAFGFDWLGTRRLMADPTYVGGFGYLRIGVAAWIPIFAAMMPVLGLFDLVVTPGVAQLVSKLWSGQAAFEQMVNTLTFATVPSLVVGWLNEWLTGVPLNLISGHPYWFVAAMEGKFGSTLAVIWNVYATAVYVIPWLWGIALGTLAIHRVQRIPVGAALVIMLTAFGMSMVITTTFVR